MGHKKLKQISPATPGWYSVFEDKDENTGTVTYHGHLVAAWGLIEEECEDEGEPPYTYAVPLSPENDMYALENYTNCSNYVRIYFRPEWFRQCPTNYVDISSFDPGKSTQVSD